jgi:hypothetical protein
VGLNHLVGNDVPEPDPEISGTLQIGEEDGESSLRNWTVDLNLTHRSDDVTRWLDAIAARLDLVTE